MTSMSFSAWARGTSNVTAFSVSAIARIVSGKWTLLVLRDLMQRPVDDLEVEEILDGARPPGTRLANEIVLALSAGTPPPEWVADELDRLVRDTQEAVDEFGVCFLASDVDADGGEAVLASGLLERGIGADPFDLLDRDAFLEPAQTTQLHRLARRHDVHALAPVRAAQDRVVLLLEPGPADDLAGRQVCRIY